MSGVKAPPFGFLTLLVMLSGFCSLVYQVVWDRTIRYNFGGDNVSAAIVTATFLLGLGIGAFAFGRWRRRAFLTYSLLELGIGIYAILSFHIMSPLGSVLAGAFDTPITSVEGLRLPIVLACILTLLPPCILMGGSLPLMFNCFVRPGEYRGRLVGWIYGWNTVGAALGALAAPFLFLNHLSISSVLQLVGILNIALAGGIYLYGRLQPKLALQPDESAPQTGVSAPQTGKSKSKSKAKTKSKAKATATPAPAPAPAPTGHSRLGLSLSFLSGFVLLGYEVALFRNFYVVYPSLPYNFAFVLAPFLVSLALGSILFTRFREYSETRARRRLGILFPLSATSMLVAVWLGADYLTEGAGRLRFTPGWWVAPYCAMLCMLPPFLAGGIFPLLLRLAASRGQSLPRQTGVLYLVNSTGAFLGALLTQFVGFSLLGTPGVFTLLFFLGLGAGLWMLASTGARVPRPLLLPVAALALCPFLVSTPTWDVFRFGHTPVRTPDREQWIGVEGQTGFASIEWRPSRGTGVVKVNGQKMALLPHDAVDLAVTSLARSVPEHGRVLVLGLGGGSSVRHLTEDPAVSSIDVVDWSHELPRVLETPKAREMLDDCLSDPRLRLFRCDARVAISLYEEDEFDVIIDNLSIPGWIGSTSVKSVTYFGMIKRILKPGGLFVYRNLGQARDAIVAGLSRNFAHLQAYNFQIVVCSESPLRTDLAFARTLLSASRGASAEPAARWKLTLRDPIDPADYADVEPVRDDLLIHEYRLHPFPHASP